MKKITQIVIGMLVLSFNVSQAQVALDEVNVSAKQAAEASSFVEVRYYYYPNLQAYFDTKVGMYLFQEDGEWVEAEQISQATMGYSLKNGQYVMIKDYTGDDPYDFIEQHQAEYPADYSSRPQKRKDVAAK